MSLSFAPEVKIGRDAGWILAFHQITRDGIDETPVFELSRDDYYADIRASLPGGLEGGSYTFTIEGVTDKDYAQIAQKDSAPSIVRLYLYYRDLELPDLGIGTNLLGSDFINAGSSTSKTEKHQNDLVAELSIVSVQRKAGTRKYEATITARELVFDQVQTRYACGDPIDLTDQKAAVTALMKRAWPYPEGSVPFAYYEVEPRSTPPPDAAPPDDDAADHLDFRQSILTGLQTIAQQLEQRGNRYGRGMLLIRNGKLHVGQRTVPLSASETKPKALTLSQGLIESVTLDPLETDPNWDPCQNSYKPSPKKQQYRLTLHGRGDLKPGDLAAFDCPPEDVSSTKPALGGALGALGDLGKSLIDTAKSLVGASEMANPTQIYVTAVEHHFSRTEGFLTTITGVQVGTGSAPTADEIWDAHSPATTPKEPAARPPRGTVEEHAADAVLTLVRRELGKLTDTDIGEVRSFRPADEGALAGQTSTVFRGLVPLAGRNQSRRASIKRPSDAPAEGVPYVTPFAWGKCGLVLPRYPGMRVALGHRHFETGDPLDLGAVWETGHAPAAKLGDWWLSLPAAAPTGNAPGEKEPGSPNDYSGTVTDDLTDASGNRVIQAGALVIRVGSGSLKTAGSRPDNPAKPDSVTIEHPGSGAFIQIDKDGNITLKGANVNIQADTKVSIQAPSVEVSCSSMEVK